MNSRLVLKNLNLLDNGFFAAFIYCFWSYFNVWSFNYLHQEYIDYSRLSIMFGITFLFSVLIGLILWLLMGRRSLRQSFFGSAAFMGLFLNFHLFPKQHPLLYIYFILLFASLFFIYYLAKISNFRKCFVLLPIGGCMVLLINIITSPIMLTGKDSFESISKSGDLKDWSQSEFSLNVGQPKHSPNVYFIIVDSTLRNDAFKRFFDNQDKDYDDFLNYAKGQGFYVVKNAYSNFPVTATSIPSTLNMDFMAWDNLRGPEDIRKRTYSYNYKTVLQALRGYNAVTSAFKARGYKIYHTNNGFLPPSSCAGYEDECIAKKKKYLFSQQELSFIKMTPINYIMDKIAINYGHTTPNDFIPDFRDDTIVYFHSFQPRDIPEYMPAKSDKPFFWFVHTMGMHNLAFDKNCNYFHPISAAGKNPAQCNKKLYAGCGLFEVYRQQLSCMFSQLRFAIDSIIERDPEAIIIVQGDHGSSINNNFRERPGNLWTESDIHEVFSILNIIRCPKDCQAMLYDNITPVNTFRVIFSYIDDKKYSLLPDVSYIAVYKNWYPDAKNVLYIEPALKQHNLSKVNDKK